MKLNKTSWTNFPNFKPNEFACGCHCEKEYTEMNMNLLFVLQSIREHYGVPVIVTSGHRCKEFNSTLPNASPTSDHMADENGEVKSADFYLKGGQSSTLAGRIEIMKYIMQFPCVSYCYCNGKKATKNGKWYNVSSPLMGASIHISVN